MLLREPTLLQDFQLPLSGSLMFYRRRKVYLVMRFLSTPSLGITGSQEGEGGRVRGIAEDLSTPSLGITEPDSGIFRLSAAFCRGAPSHK